MESESVKPATAQVKTSRRTLQCTWCSQLGVVLEANSADRKNLQIFCHGIQGPKPWDCSLMWETCSPPVGNCPHAQFMAFQCPAGPWVTGVTQTMFLLCHWGWGKVLSRHGAARAQAPLSVGWGCSWVVSAVTVPWQPGV